VLCLKPRTVSSPRKKVHEPIVHRIVQTEAGSERADPEAPPRVYIQTHDGVGGKAVRITLFVAIDLAGVAVEPCKSAYGADPDEALAVADDI